MTTLLQGIPNQNQGLSGRGGESQPEVNVGHNERLGSVLGGSLIILLGLRQRSTFGALMMAAGGALVYRGVTGHCPAYASMGKNTAQAADAPADATALFEHGIHVEQSYTINKPAEELYAFWKNFENLPQFMNHLESVKVLGDKKSHWVAKAPAGFKVEWDAEIIKDEPNKTIAWRSIGNADVTNAGSVRFLPAAGDRGTEMKVVLDYLPPAGQLGRIVAKLFGEEPQQQIHEDLARFKQLMETGEVATTKGQPTGR